MARSISSTITRAPVAAVSGCFRPAPYLRERSRRAPRFGRLISSAMEHRPEIGAGAFRLMPRGFRRCDEAKIAVNQPGAMMVLRRDAGGRKRFRVGPALVAQGIEPRRANHRGREARKILRAQRRHPPVQAVLGVLEIVAGGTFPHSG